MPRIGQIGENFPTDITSEGRNLALALCEIYEALQPNTMKANSELLGVSEASLSHYLHGRRVPSEATLRRLHTAVSNDARVAGRQVPVAMNELVRLRLLARNGPCHCGGGRDGKQDRRNGNSRPEPSAADGDRRNGRTSAPLGVAEIIDSIVRSGESERIGLLWALGKEMSDSEGADLLYGFAASGMMDECRILANSIRAAKVNLGAVGDSQIPLYRVSEG